MRDAVRGVAFEEKSGYMVKLPGVVVKDTMSAMVELAVKFEESSSDVIGYGMVSHAMTISRENVWRAMPSSLASGRRDGSLWCCFRGEQRLHGEVAGRCRGHSVKVCSGMQFMVPLSLRKAAVW